ncbi:MAG: response regulator [Alphaproteobacteria bacterium]|nr:response regulator [Alphaproteobacteria bacterium]
MARILVIDDEDLVRFTIEQILMSAGHVVATAENGAAGMRRQREIRFDLVITDIMMPEQDGIETIRALKAEFPALPIIAISGGGRMGNLNYLDMAKGFGVSAAIPKPFTPDEILTRVETALKH